MWIVCLCFKWNQVTSTSSQLLKGLLQTSEAASVFSPNEDGTQSRQVLGVCPTHGFISKKSGIQSLINTSSLTSLGLTTVESHITMKYSNTVLHIETSNSKITGKQFKRILTCFPYLKGSKWLQDISVGSERVKFLYFSIVPMELHHWEIPLRLKSKQFSVDSVVYM